MKENKLKVIGITKNMELHIHGTSEEKEWYSNLSIIGILGILEEYTNSIGDEKETEMLDHLSVYFYDQIWKSI